MLLNNIKKIYLPTLIFLLLTPSLVLAADNDIICPEAQATEVLVYFHGLTHNDHSIYVNSLNTFKSELAKIKNQRPGVAGIHVNNEANGGNWKGVKVNVSALVDQVKNKCGVQAGANFYTTIAGHSAGGYAVINNANSASKIIILDGMYWPADPLFDKCSKISVIGGSVAGNGGTKDQTTRLINKCYGTSGFNSIANSDGKISHDGTRAYLSSFYLNSSGVVSVSSPNTSQNQNKTNSTFNVSLPMIKNPFDSLQVMIPGMPRFSDAVISGSGNNMKITINWIGEYIMGIYNYAIGVIGIFSVVAIAIGGTMWILSFGNPGQIIIAKEWILGAILGLVLALGSYILLNTINDDLIQMKPIELAYIQRIEDPGDNGSGGDYYHVGPNQVGQPYSGQDPNNPCPASTLPDLTQYYAYKANPPLIYSQDPNKRRQAGYCDCSSFSQHLAICSRANAIAGEGRTINLFKDVSNNREEIMDCDNPPKMSPGDIFGYYSDSKERGHVLTYIGNGQYIECGGEFKGNTQTRGAIKIGPFRERCLSYKKNNNIKLFFISR